MERQLHRELEKLQEDVLRMGAEVEAMITDAMEALVDQDNARAKGIKRKDKGVDALEKEIDEDCLRILATHQPTAVDLRFLVAVMKITNDLERMGDSAVNIAKGVLILNDEEPLEPYVDLPQMARLAEGMVRDSLDALVRKDASLALSVWKRDDELDDSYERLFRELLTSMTEQPETVSRALHLLLVARNLERIGDHATNVAEDVVYYVEGRDIRHPTAVDSIARSTSG